MKFGVGFQLMIPGRVECPSQWMMEYSGYLMSTPGKRSYSGYLKFTSC